MSDEEREAATALSKCTFVPGTPPKRFARDMASAARHKPDLELTDGQRKYLFDLLHRFRRQIPKTHAKLCVTCNQPKVAA